MLVLPASQLGPNTHINTRSLIIVINTVKTAQILMRKLVIL